jgi:hypothetical protein
MAIEDAQGDRLRRPGGARSGDDRGRDIRGADLDFPQDRRSGFSPHAKELDPEWLRSRDVVSVGPIFGFLLRKRMARSNLAGLPVKHKKGVHFELGRDVEADAASRLARDRAISANPRRWRRNSLHVPFAAPHDMRRRRDRG